ncbi:hypothetical protein LSH36_975g00033 [Paralvinella palmiformis]|uniref:Uncharacterized protein n=1 Tax=Paralvinella palmiformis TaxID=53620 RepID=A0AAD9IWK4_9ANNE|nr:hypothetical protein LSH36_975g00033 [Paralvinella palmiformis]
MNWSPCNPRNGKRHRIMVLRHKQPPLCNPIKTIHRKCIFHKHLKHWNHGRHCEYEDSFMDWFGCHPVTKLQQKIVLLKHGQPNYCPKAKVLTKKCMIRTCPLAELS